MRPCVHANVSSMLIDDNHKLLYFRIDSSSEFEIIPQANWIGFVKTMCSNAIRSENSVRIKCYDCVRAINTSSRHWTKYWRICQVSILRIVVVGLMTILMKVWWKTFCFYFFAIEVHKLMSNCFTLNIMETFTPKPFYICNANNNRQVQLLYDYFDKDENRL